MDKFQKLARDYMWATKFLEEWRLNLNAQFPELKRQTEFWYDLESFRLTMWLYSETNLLLRDLK